MYGALKSLITAAMFHRGINHSINWVFKEHKPTHSCQKAELIGSVSLASDRADGRQTNMLPMGGISTTRRQPCRGL